MAEQDALLKAQMTHKQSLEAMMSESLDSELAGLYDTVGTQKAALAEQVAKHKELERELQAKRELLSANEQERVALLRDSSEITALQDELQKKNDVIAFYAVGHPGTPGEEFQTCRSHASSSSQRAPEVGSAYESPSPAAQEPFGASVDWGGSSARADTLSVNSSEKYRWFNNDDLESCDDEVSVTNDPYC